MKQIVHEVFFDLFSWVVFGTLCAILFFAGRRLRTLLWVGVGMGTSILLYVLDAPISPILWVVAYLVLTLLFGVALLLRYVGRSIPLA